MKHFAILILVLFALGCKKADIKNDYPALIDEYTWDGVAADFNDCRIVIDDNSKIILYKNGSVYSKDNIREVMYNSNEYSYTIKVGTGEDEIIYIYQDGCMHSWNFPYEGIDNHFSN